MTITDKKRAIQAAKQLIEANKESRLAMIHARELVKTPIAFLQSARPNYRTYELSFKETACKMARIVELSRYKSSQYTEEKHKQTFDQLNKVYSGELRPEEKDFLVQTKRYWRDRFADSE
jgi:hypothetical protein